MATIRDVAAQAGVSTKTVSRVLNDEPHVRPEVRERVEAAAKALAYRPNQAARRLGGGRSFLIAHLYDNPNAAYIASIQAASARRCRELGYHLVVEPVESHGFDIAHVIERLVATLAPDGVILTPPLCDNPLITDQFDRAGTPIARISPAGPVDGIGICVNERAAGRAVTDHLLALGHCRIGIVRGHPEHHAAGLRFDGYRDALAGAGIRLETALVAQGYFDLQSGIEAGRALLGARSRPTAIFATNDDMAVGVIMAARELGLDVPHELSVAGFDDTPMSRLIWPPLTTIRQPVEEMGRAAVEALVGKRAAGMIELPFELLVRSSTAPPAT